MKFKTAYEDHMPASDATGLSMLVVDPDTGEVREDFGRTQQEFKVECDINEIVRRFGLTGKLPDDLRVPVSGDFVGISDFNSAMLAVRQAEEAFMEMPADLRARFANDPAKLMSFLDDPNNRDEAVKLGLVSKTPPAPRDAVQAIDELASKLVAPKAAS